MGYSFDGTTKIISLTSGTTSFSVVDLWSRWCDWLAIGDNSKYLPAMRYVGNDPISETKNLGATFFMLNGWKIKPQEANHTLVVSGNLYTDPAGTSPFIPTLGNFNVTIEMQVSNLSDSTVAQMDQINAAVYRGEIALDATYGVSGSVFPKGTHALPVNNVSDAKTLASNYGIEVIKVHGAFTFESGHDLSNYVLKGENAITTLITVTPGAVVVGCQFEDMIISNSTLDGYGYVKHCHLYNVAGLEGYVEACMLSGSLSITGTQNLYFVDCKSGCVGLGTSDLPVLNMSGSNRHIAFRNFAGPIKITNSTDPLNTICLDIGSGATIILDSSCTAGKVYVRGIAQLVNNSTMDINNEVQLNATNIANEVLNTQIGTSRPTGSLGEFLAKKVLTLAKFIGLK